MFKTFYEGLMLTKLILRKLHKWDRQHLSDALFFLTSPMKNIKKEEPC